MAERPFDAVLLVSFGGPEAREDVMPFLANVTRGRNIPRERLEEVAEHYYAVGGVSPINAHCRDLIAALQRELDAKGPQLPVYWGNRNWKPMLAETVAQMSRDGIRRAVAIATSAFSSYSGCRQYLEDIENARAAAGTAAPVIEKIPPFWDHPAFIETMAASTADAMGRLGTAPPQETRLLFSAHSIPTAMAANCDYQPQLEEASGLIADRAAPGVPWELVYQSRSGPPTQPWLEPDVCDRIAALAARGIKQVVVVPVGFVADHMEVLHDLDKEARETAERVGVRMARAATVGAEPAYVRGLRGLIAAHIDGRKPESLARSGPRPNPCMPGCCAYNPVRPDRTPPH